MDPNAALEELRRLIREFDLATTAELEPIANDLVNVIEGLDSWLSRGGYLPSDWQVVDMAGLLERAGKVEL